MNERTESLKFMRGFLWGAAFSAGFYLVAGLVMLAFLAR